MPKQKYAYKSICAHGIAKIESSFEGLPTGGWGWEGGGAIWESWSRVLNSNLNPNLSTALHFVVHDKHCDGVCDAMCSISYIVYMGPWAINLPPLPISATWTLPQSIVQMSKLHLLCASQKLKQIILPIAFWFPMSLAADWVASDGWLPGWSTSSDAGSRPDPGDPPTVYVNFRVYLPPVAPEIMQCLY